MGFRIKPKDEKFFQLLGEHSALLKISADLLYAGIHKEDKLEDLIDKIDTVEKQADEIVGRVTEKLHKTFITPFDREDIYTLIQQMDSVIDCNKGVVERMHLYNITTVSEGAKELAELVVKAAKQIEKAISYLDDMKKSRLKLEARCTRIVEIEADGDSVYRLEMSKLFRECTDPIELIKWKEILTQLEEVLDLSQDVADALKRVVLKYA